MMPTTIQIDSQILGTSPTHNPLDAVIVQLPKTFISVGELIKRAVEAQVRDLAVCRRESASIIRQTLDQFYVVSNSSAAMVHPTLSALLQRAEPKINIRSEVRNALNAFESGAFSVMVDGEPIQNIDQKVHIQSDSRVVFVCRPVSLTA